MKNFNLLDHIHTAVAVIGKDMTVIEANNAYKLRNNIKINNYIDKKCFTAANNFNEPCSAKTDGTCPVSESFKTKKSSSTINHSWIEGRAIVEEITTTPIIEENGEVNFVVEEFRDLTKLLGLKKGIIGICSYCRKIHDEDGNWVSFEAYLSKHTGAHFSHGICEDCYDKESKKIEKKDSCTH